MERPTRIGNAVGVVHAAHADDCSPLAVGGWPWLCGFGQRPSANGQRVTPRYARGDKRRERGFTLAGVIVLLTIMMIFAAYTVPRQWSAILQRDRDKQTIFIMRQYAKAISAFQDKNKTWPVSMDQLKDARAPRFLRGPKDGYIDPLTGQIDWLIIPASAVGATGQPLPRPPNQTANPTQTAPAATSTAAPGVPMKDYAGGPFIGVRPNKSGKSLLEFNTQQAYDMWMYTAFDYRAERDARLLAAAKKWQ
jgi:type II secretory pathway pseudopilin PulG